MTAIARPAPFDLAPATRTALVVAGLTVLLLSLYAIGRALLGYVAIPANAKEVAVVVHLSTVLPAVPLGLYILTSRKGGARHRMLGRIWMGLMVTTALATLAIRHANNGSLSWIHVFTFITLISSARAVWAARNGRIAAHKRGVVLLYAGSLVVAGLFTFVPGRIMFRWLVG